jgi:hypothetical protein
MVRALLDGTKTQTRRVVKPQPEWTEPATVWQHGDGHSGIGWYASNEDYPEEGALHYRCPYGQPGDTLWIKETFFAWGRWETRFSAKKGRDEWHFIDMTDECGKSYLYAADGVSDTQAFIKRRGGVSPMYWKRPAIFMPRTASRITQEITGVRVERLQDVTEEDAKAEGCQRLDDDEPGYIHRDEPDWKLCPRCGGTRLYTAFNPATGGALLDTDCTECDTYAKRYRHLWESINGAESWAANPWVWAITFRVIKP